MGAIEQGKRRRKNPSVWQISSFGRRQGKEVRENRIPEKKKGGNSCGTSVPTLFRADQLCRGKGTVDTSVNPSLANAAGREKDTSKKATAITVLSKVRCSVKGQRKERETRGRYRSRPFTFLLIGGKKRGEKVVHLLSYIETPRKGGGRRVLTSSRQQRKKAGTLFGGITSGQGGGSGRHSALNAIRASCQRKARKTSENKKERRRTPPLS